MSNTSKVCLTVGAVAWLGAIVALAITGQADVAYMLMFCGLFGAVVILGAARL